MNGIIYKTTNLINGKIYIGQHSTNDKNYLGSGVRLFSAIKKYGKQNFIRETLKECKTQKELDAFEQVYIKRYNSINEEFGYNILTGTANKFGSGSPALLPDIKVKMSIAMQERLKSGWKPKHYLTEEHYKAHSEFMKEYFKTHDQHNKGKKIEKEKHAMYGKKHSLETKNKMSLNHADFSGKNNPMYGIKICGDKNPAFGKKWITNGKENKYIDKDDDIPFGFRKGVTRGIIKI